MTSAINTATTTERELTIDELDAVSGGASLGGGTAPLGRAAGEYGKNEQKG
jgi:bacteriocin-like protein